MKKAIEIRTLNDDETVAAMNMPKFDSLKPVRCSKCNYQGSFARRVFAVSGVPKSKYSDDETQEAISDFITGQFGISHVFFKSPGSGTKLYVDSAICPECQSTKIVFDIELTSDFFREFSKNIEE
jgi:DNA-directed RNA polymerase subunit M/transcription elongation factor TFIIS